MSKKYFVQRLKLIKQRSVENSKPSENTDSPPELQKILWKAFVKIFGTKWAVILFAVVALAFLSVRWVPHILSTTSGIQDYFRNQFPARPKFAPSRFTVGIYIRSGNHVDSSLSSALKASLFGVPDLDFHEIHSLTGNINGWIHNNDKKAEEVIKEWISETGASGVLWGEKLNINGRDYYFLKWTHPDVQDFVNERTSNWLYNPITVFPLLRSDQITTLVSVYIKELIEQNNRELDKPMKFVTGISNWQKDSLKAIFNHVCHDGGYSRENCRYMQMLKLEFYMRNDDSDSYFKEQQTFDNPFYDATERFLDYPLYPKTAEQFQTYNLALDYLFIKTERDGDSAYFSYLKKWTDIPNYRFGMAVERAYPIFKEFRDLMKAHAGFICCLDTIYYRKRDEKTAWPLDELSQNINLFEQATRKLMSSEFINGFQKLELLNRMGVMYIKQAQVFQLVNKPCQSSIKKGQTYLKKANESGQWYQYRTPRYLASTKLNYANALLMDSDADKDISQLQKAIGLTEQARKIAIAQGSFELEEESLLRNAEALSKLAVIQKNKNLHCMAVSKWNESIRSQSDNSFSLSEDTVIDSIMIRFYNSVDRKYFDNCLKEHELNPEAVYDSLKDRLKKK